MNRVFCERLKELRQERGLGQIGLAKALDVGKSVVSLWEIGKCEPTLSKLITAAFPFGERQWKTKHKNSLPMGRLKGYKYRWLKAGVFMRPWGS